MKKLSDGSEVSARSYYYLLDWNQVNEYQYIVKEFGKTRLKDLDIVEYIRLFYKATRSEMDSWN